MRVINVFASAREEITFAWGLSAGEEVRSRPFKRILIAVDDRVIAGHAAEIGVELGKMAEADVALIYVAPQPVPYGADAGLPAGELVRMAKDDGKALLASFRTRLALDASSPAFLEMGEPAREIGAAAKTWPADIIVIGSHGRRGIQRAMLGGVGDAVMRSAPCPVLIVRGSS